MDPGGLGIKYVNFTLFSTRRARFEVIPIIESKSGLDRITNLRSSLARLGFIKSQNTTSKLLSHKKFNTWVSICQFIVLLTLLLIIIICLDKSSHFFWLKALCECKYNDFRNHPSIHSNFFCNKWCICWRNIENIWVRIFFGNYPFWYLHFRYR